LIVRDRKFARFREFRNLDISPKYKPGALRNFAGLPKTAAC
jgi:hypothetical protein